MTYNMTILLAIQIGSDSMPSAAEDRDFKTGGGGGLRGAGTGPYSYPFMAGKFSAKGGHRRGCC